MTELLVRLMNKARKEMRYTRGMQTMHRERYVESCHNLARARATGDYARMHAIIQDLAAFTGEMDQLIDRRRGVYERFFMLQQDERIANPVSAPDDPDTSQGA